MELYKLNDWYRKEILMIDSKYALAREYISKIEELTNDKKFKTSSFNSIDFLNNASKILDIKKLNKMLYCSNEEKEKYLVYIHDDSLCYKINSNFKKIDSIEIFKNMFNNRTPDEDEEYLEKSGNPVPNIRRGKAKHSNVIIDTSGKIYIFPYRSNTIHHTFISHGSDVIFAGTIGLENGKITYIDNSSGHYRTNFKDISRLLLFLKHKNKFNFSIKNIFSSSFMFKTDIVFKRHWEEPKIDLEKQNKYKEFLYYSFINDNETISNINEHLFKGTL